MDAVSNSVILCSKIKFLTQSPPCRGLLLQDMSGLVMTADINTWTQEANNLHQLLVCLSESPLAL